MAECLHRKERKRIINSKKSRENNEDTHEGR